MHDHHDPCAVNSLVEKPGCNPVEGRVVWDPAHSLWNGGMMLATLALGPSTFTWSAFVVFVILTGAISDEEAKKLYPGGYKQPKPYIRIAPQPRD